jgi:hypothetical protein
MRRLDCLTLLALVAYIVGAAAELATVCNNLAADGDPGSWQMIPEADGVPRLPEGVYNATAAAILDEVVGNTT